MERGGVKTRGLQALVYDSESALGCVTDSITQCRVEWSHGGRKGHGICSFFLTWRKKQDITHTHKYSPSWLLCNTTVSLQLWPPRNPCVVQQPQVIWQYQGPGKRDLMKKQDKGLKLPSCYHLFAINLHLAKMDTTISATAANWRHKMTS